MTAVLVDRLTANGDTLEPTGKDVALHPTPDRDAWEAWTHHPSAAGTVRVWLLSTATAALLQAPAAELPRWHPPFQRSGTLLSALPVLMAEDVPTGYARPALWTPHQAQT